MVFKQVTAKAPVNIAVIKYWGKADEKLKIPINDSISGTLSLDELCTTTTIKLSDIYTEDELYLNNVRQNLDADGQRFRLLIKEVRDRSPNKEMASLYALIESENNFPTAAGLASSAAGFACLAFVLGHAFEITDRRELSILARIGSGSACRSLYGGFVRWHKGNNSETSVAEQLYDHNHWPEIRVLICVANEAQKEISSSLGMRCSKETSKLLDYRASAIVPTRIDEMIKAIGNKDFESFGRITMQDSNQFHAICLDTWPPIRYLNDTSNSIIRLCSSINKFYGKIKVAYTFDAGPNACIYTTQEMIDRLIVVIQHFYPGKGGLPLTIKGRLGNEDDEQMTRDATVLVDYISSQNQVILTNSLSYLINTKIGEGPKLV